MLCIIFSNKKSTFFVSTIIFILIELVLRCYCVFRFNLSWDFGVRKQVFLRMDAIMMGVIFSGIKIYYYESYERIAKSKLTLFISLLGLVVLGVVYIFYLGIGNNFNNSNFYKIFLFNFMNLFCLLFIIWIECSNMINNKVNRVLFTFISEISYGIYLIHWPIFKIISNKLYGFNGYVVSLILTVVLARFLYVLYEKPIMNLRDRFS